MSPGTKINQNNNNYDDSNEHWNQDQAQGYTLPLILELESRIFESLFQRQLCKTP